MQHIMLSNVRQLSEEEERELALKYVQGDEEAGITLLRSQGPWVHSKLRKFNIPSTVDIDDVLSELAIILLQSLKSFNPQFRLTTFFGMIVDRRTPRILSKLAPDFAAVGGDDQPRLDLEDCRSAESKTPEQIELLRQAQDVCRECLSETSQQILMDHLNKIPLEEIAGRLNKTLATKGDHYRQHNLSSVRKILHASLDIVRNEMQRRGLVALGKGVQLSLF